MDSIQHSYRQTFRLAVLFFIFLFNGCNSVRFPESELSQKFNGRYGQIEIGGTYAGLEFHHSRPSPSRISFYYPVANSIDLSTDYWQRDQSLPYTILVDHNNKTDNIALESCDYSYTPYQVQFEKTDPDYSLQINYSFCDDLPVVVIQFALKNKTNQETEFSIITECKINLRTCHTYAPQFPSGVDFGKHDQYALARFDSKDTDSCLVFVLNPVKSSYAASGLENISTAAAVPVIRFRHVQKLAAGQELNTVQVIGSCKQTEWDSVLVRVTEQFRGSIERNRQKMLNYIQGQSHLSLADTTILKTFYWSKAILAANRHYLNGTVVPMPCPAEYNFFFTHDALLTDLAAVYFDVDRVRRDLLYLYSLSKADSILPHAYYFKDGVYQTEFCSSDNWNHLWFLILAGTYYQHSYDQATIKQISPLLQKSLAMMMQNKGRDQLMYAFRPDWWDIGHVYGARSYLTILMIQALRSYVQIGPIAGLGQQQMGQYLILADQMQDSLLSRLWDERRGYFINMLDTVSTDTHYYAGSLLAAVFNILDNKKCEQLLRTAGSKLLDPNIGIRIAMPPDFHHLVDIYKFNGLEMGKPYLYLNGGSWPHGTAWYILGQINTGQIAEAENALKKYLTLDGIMHSPNGQPSFYEYRNTDPRSTQYGQIDKPTFLWAAGWYLYTLYHLMGVREYSGYVYLYPELPSDFGQNTEYDLMIAGRLVRIQYQGSGKYFKQILFDAQQVFSSIPYKPVHSVKLICGIPQQPYLSRANVKIDTILFNQDSKIMEIWATGIAGQHADVELVTPLNLESVKLGQLPVKDCTMQNDDGIQTWKISFTLSGMQDRIYCQYQ